MAEHRYVLTGADRYGVFYELRSDDPAKLLRLRDTHGDKGREQDRSGNTAALYEVIDCDAVDPPERGTMEWCDDCLAEPVLSKAGEESLCEKCEDVGARAT